MSRRSFVALLLFVIVIGAGAVVYLAPQAHPGVAAASPKASPVSMPLFFEPNQGQTDPQVKFLARGSHYGIFLTANEAVLKLQSPARSTQRTATSAQLPAVAVVRMKLEGASSAASVSGVDQLPGKSSYFIGNDPSRWRSGIPQFGRVEYKSVYPGINLIYYGNEGHLEYDFRVSPSADPNQIALSFDGAAPQIDSGDLVLSTEQGEIRFHAPRVYQQVGTAEREIAGNFRQIADNKIGFTLGAYDHSRELVIDPVLSYSTYIGGSANESSVHVTVGPDNNIYLAGSTMSADFPVVSPLQGLAGAQNIFVAEINPNAALQLVYATYLGGNGIDTAAGVAVEPNVDPNPSGFDIYVAGTTTSSNFPTSTFLPPFQPGPETGSHSFVTRLNPTSAASQVLRYSTYLAGNGADSVTGLAVDAKGDAFVTGTTTSTNSATGFPSTINAFQPCPFQPGVTCNVISGPTQFFASKINTIGTGTASMVYSTFFGGGYPTSGDAPFGGAIVVDVSGNMYFTGGTNMPGVTGPNGEAPFPLFNAQQSCLNVPLGVSSSNCPPPTTAQATDAFVAKINPNIASQPPVFSTYLGGSSDDVGSGVAVDGSGNVYVTGHTSSADWIFPTTITPFQSTNGGGEDAFLAKVANPSSSGAVFPMVYFTYLGGTGTDSGQAVVVDATQGAHIVGTTNSPGIPFGMRGYSGAGDAFVALISTTISSTSSASGNYFTYLGGSGADEGTSIALDLNNVTYVSGTTASGDFPTVNPFQGSLAGGSDAFVSKLSPESVLKLTPATNSPSPNPPVAGSQEAFTFDIANTGPDPATNVIFTATFLTGGLSSQAAKVTTGSGSCGTLSGNTITCTISSLAVQPSSTSGFGVVEVDATPTLPVLPGNAIISVRGDVSANGGPVQSTLSQSSASITDFAVGATPAQQTITAGQNASFDVTLTPTPTYTATVSMTDSGLPPASTATFTTTSVSLSGTANATTTLNIATTPRPVTTGSLFRGRAFFATCLPIGGLSLLGLGIGGSRKRRTWIGLALLGLLMATLLLQPGCGNSSAASTSGGTTAGTYTINITGTNGSVSHTTTVRLVVN